MWSAKKYYSHLQNLVFSTAYHLLKKKESPLRHYAAAPLQHTGGHLRASHKRRVLSFHSPPSDAVRDPSKTSNKLLRSISHRGQRSNTDRANKRSNLCIIKRFIGFLVAPLAICGPQVKFPISRASFSWGPLDN